MSESGPISQSGAATGSDADKLLLPKSCVKRIMKLNGELLLIYALNYDLFAHHNFVRCIAEDVKVVSAVRNSILIIIQVLLT